MRRIAVPAAALFLAAQASCAVAAEATRLSVGYSIYLTGLPVASAQVVVDLKDDGFIVRGSAKTASLIRIISRGEGTARTSGSFRENRIAASLFTGRYKTRREQKIEISVEDGVAKKISIEPPLPRIDKNRVPLTEDSRTNILDPLSATLVSVPAKTNLLAPESCNRTLPIFDGRYRFNVVLSYVRTEKAPAGIEGYQGQTLVCQARYVPIAGHRTEGDTIKQMAANREMFVWLAPIKGTRVLVPVRASVATPIGTFVVEATSFEAKQR